MDASGRLQTIVNNTVVLMVSQAVTWALALLLAVFLPRYLGAEAVGQLQLTTTIWGIAWACVAFGSEAVVTREIARRPERAGDLVLTTIIMRMLFFAAGCGVMAVYLAYGVRNATLFDLVVILGAAQLVLLVGNALQAALQGMQRLQSVAAAAMISKAVFTFLALGVVISDLNVTYVAAATVAGNIVQLAVVFIALAKGGGERWRFRADLALWVVKSSAPFLATGLLVILYQETSVIVVSTIVDERAVGWFSTARTLVSTMTFVPMILIAAIFPAASRSHSEGGDVVNAIAGRTVDVMLLCGVPIGLGTFVISGPLVHLLYGDQFAPCVPVLSILGLSLIATYQTVIIGRLLAAVDRQTAWAYAMLGAAVAKVVLDIVLVWVCARVFENGAIGAALSLLIVEILMAVIGMLILPRGTLTVANRWFAMRVFFAGLVMAAVAWSLKGEGLIASIIAGAASYGLLIALMRVIPPDELQFLKRMFAATFGGIARRINVWR